MGLEKESESDADSNYLSDTSSFTSSRQSLSSSSSHQPILSTKPSSSTNRRSRRNLSPHRIIRLCCLALISTVVIFILSLVHAGISSTKRVEAGNIGRRPTPPPEPWKAFPFLTRYYGGLRSLTPLAENTPEYPLKDEPTTSDKPSKLNRDVPVSIPFEAYAHHQSPDYLAEYPTVQKCFLDANSTVSPPSLQYYYGRPAGFPNNILGSYELLGLPEDICFDRFGRLGPYGYGYAEKYGGTGTGEYGDIMGSSNVWNTGSEINQVDFRNVNWNEAQRRCFNLNKARFEPIDSIHERTRYSSKSNRASDHYDSTKANISSIPKKYLPRSAVVIRVWDDFNYGLEDILHLRAMISELSLGSAGEYDVHLLVQVKDESKYPIWADEESYQRHVNESVPEEFRGITTLWSVTQMLMLYQGIHDTFARGPDLPIHGPYRGLQMAMQHFAHTHPEYEYFWHWEIDIRYTGHYYNLFSQVESWAQKQSRKGLWERNNRFYIPTTHGSWDDFKHLVRVQTEMSSSDPERLATSLLGLKAKTKTEKPIWGPERPEHEEDWFEVENDPVPPRSYDNDRYEWGVGEPADLITFNPLFDPEETTWLLANDFTGFNTSTGSPPRRAAIITTSRMSKRLLESMHRETAFKKHHAFSEMWAPTVALHHGYKAVYVPHPTFVDRKWPVAYFSAVTNAGKSGATGGARTSIFGAREHNLMGLTWYYNAGFAPNLWRRWLGLRVNNDGGEQFELTADESKDGEGVGGMRGGEGRMCLPPMLLHPVKDIVLPSEGPAPKENLPTSDPSA